MDSWRIAFLTIPSFLLWKLLGSVLMMCLLTSCLESFGMVSGENSWVLVFQMNHRLFFWSKIGSGWFEWPWDKKLHSPIITSQVLFIDPLQLFLNTVCGIFNFGSKCPHNLVPKLSYTHSGYDDLSKESFERYGNVSNTRQNSQNQRNFEFVLQ